MRGFLPKCKKEGKEPCPLQSCCVRQKLKDLLLSETVMAEPRDTRCDQHTGTDKDQRDYSGPFVQRPTVSRHSLTLMNFDIVQLKSASGRQCLISIPGVETRNLGIT